MERVFSFPTAKCFFSILYSSLCDLTCDRSSGEHHVKKGKCITCNQIYVNTDLHIFCINEIEDLTIMEIDFPTSLLLKTT